MRVAPDIVSDIAPGTASDSVPDPISDRAPAALATAATQLAVESAEEPAAIPPAPAAPTAAQPVELLWVGANEGMEQALVERAGIPYRGIDTGQLRGINPMAALRNVGKMLRGLRQSLAIVGEFKPDVCFVTGGYVCAPVVVACRLRRVPVMIYLPDMTPGWAIRTLSRLAQRVAVTFDDAARYFGGIYPQGKAVVTGYPVRPELIEAAQDRAATRQKLATLIDRPPLNGEDELPLLLVFGGSQGARSINQAIWAALPDLLPHAHVLHVVGTRDWPLAKEAMQNLRSTGVLTGGTARRYHPVDYLHDGMPLALAAADLVVSRAGASVLGEFPVAGLPAILVPYPFKGVNAQDRNAEQLRKHDAAVVIDDAALSEDLERVILELLAQTERRGQMAQHAAALARPDAAARIAAQLRMMADGSRQAQPGA